MQNICSNCKVCNGKVCKNKIPGPGAKGIGDVAIRNYEKWKSIRVNLDTISNVKNVSTKVEFFDREFAMPLFAGPVGAVKLHYGEKYDDKQYNDILVRECTKVNIAAFTGDGTDEGVMIAACSAIKNNKGMGVPTVKPWDMETIKKKFKLVEGSNSFAVAMDIDASGLPFLKNLNPPAGPKTVEELSKISRYLDIPFIIKGIMTKRGAYKAVEAGAKAIVISNHGGRVLDGCLSTAEVLPEISQEVKGSTIVLVDGGIRDGVDMFKALALGADGVLLARPFVNAIYADEQKGVKNLVDKLKGELEDTMLMCGASQISEIVRNMVTVL